MLSTLLKGVDKLAPKLICILPAAAFDTTTTRAKSWLKKLSPSNVLSQRVRVFFVDPIRMQLAPTNPASDGTARGFELDFPKDWVVRAMPYVKIGLTALKVAHIAGKLTGFPIPDVQAAMGDWIGSQLGALEVRAHGSH